MWIYQKLIPQTYIVHIYINVTVDELKTNYTTVNLHLSNVLSVCTVPKAAT